MDRTKQARNAQSDTPFIDNLIYEGEVPVSTKAQFDEFTLALPEKIKAIIRSTIGLSPKLFNQFKQYKSLTFVVRETNIIDTEEKDVLLRAYGYAFDKNHICRYPFKDAGKSRERLWQDEAPITLPPKIQGALFVKRIEGKNLLGDVQFAAFISSLPEFGENIGPTAKEMRGLFSDLELIFIVKKDENDVKPRTYIEVFDKNWEQLYPFKNAVSKYRKRYALGKRLAARLPEIERDFIEAVNVSSDDSREASIFHVLRQIGYEHLLPSTASASSPATPDGEITGRPSSLSPPQQPPVATDLKEPEAPASELSPSPAVVLESTASDPLPDLPASPTKWWLKDRKENETPPQFVVRVYGSWMSAGVLKRADLKKDFSLYIALSKYLKKAKDEGLELPEGFNLPSEREISTKRKERLGVTSASEAWQRLMAVASPEVKDLLLAYHSLRRSQEFHP